MSSRTFIPCRVSAGFFSSEAYVVLRAGSAYMVDRNDVTAPQIPESGEVAGKVLAYVVDEQNEKALIELPGEPVIGGQRIWVPKNELEYVAAA